MKPVNYPSPNDFVKAISKPFDGPEFAPIAKEFGLSWADADKLAPELEIYHFQLQESGVRFAFEDEGVILRREYHDPGEGPFVLTKCTFWGHQGESKIYQGPLWKGISFNDSLDAVKAKIGEPTKINKRDDIYFWDYPEFKMTAHWVEAEKIDVVTYWMKKS